MTDLREQLRDADPIRIEGGMSALDAARVRVAVLHVVPARTATSWIAFASVAAGLMCVVAAGIWSVERAPGASTSRPVGAAGVAPPEDTGNRRQVYFSTPGGTRVIWQFNQAFELR